MEYIKLGTEESERLKQKRLELKGGGLKWRKILSDLSPMEGVSIKCADEHELRLSQFSLYRAAKRMHLCIITFKHIEDGEVILTVWLRNP